MNKIITIIATAFIAVLAGCKTVPTIESVTTNSHAVGVAVGFVASRLNMNDQSKTIVTNILAKAEECVPATNVTFAVAWTPVAEAHTQILVDACKINTTQSKLILTAFKYSVKGIDFYLAKHPEIKEYDNLTRAFIHGFNDGFSTTFLKNSDARSTEQYDEDTYNYLMSEK